MSDRIPCPDFGTKRYRTVKVKKIQARQKIHRASSKRIVKSKSHYDSILILKHKSLSSIYIASSTKYMTRGFGSSELAAPLLSNEEGDTSFVRALTVKKIAAPPRPKGQKQNVAASEPVKEKDEKKTSGWAIAGFIVSLLSLLFLITPLFLGHAVWGIVFSSIALRRIRKNPEKYKGRKLAKAGLIIGIAVLSIFLILLIFIPSFSGLTSK